MNRCKWCNAGIVYEFGAWVNVNTGDHHCGEGEHEIAGDE